LLAMRQFGCMLANLAGGLPIIERLSSDDLPKNRAAIWLPCPQELSAIEPSWDVTSDSLAIWLAGKLGATHVLLVKAALQGPRACWGYGPVASVRELAEATLVDVAFPSYLAEFRGDCWLGGPAQFRDLTTSLSSPDQCFLGIQKAD